MSPIPNIESAPLYDAQAIADASDWQNITDGFSVTGIISGCVVSAYSPPAMHVAVSAGSVASNGIITVLAAASVAIPAASTSDRRDMIVATPGAASVVMGTPCGTAGWTRSTYPGLPPVKAAIPPNAIFLGEVYVPAGATSIASGNILLSDTQLLVTGEYVTSFNGRSTQVTLEQSDVESTFTAAGQVPIGTGSGTGEYLAVGSVGTVLTSTGASTAPTWQVPPGQGAASAGVTTFNSRFGVVTFELSDAESVYTAPGQVMVGTGSATAELLSPSASVGWVLTSNGAASIPSWQQINAVASVTAALIESTFTGAGKIYVGTGVGTGELLSAGSVGTVLTSAGAASVPSWQPVTSGVTSFNTRSGSVTLLSTDVSAAGGLLAANNLSDVTNAGTSRENIHVPILAACQTVATASVSTSAPTNGPWNAASVTVGGQILLTAQTTQSQNGPFIFNGPSSALTRPTDYSTGASVGSRIIQITNGSYANTEWMTSTTSTIIVDTTATTWTALSAGDAAVIVAGTLGATPTIALANIPLTQVTGTLSANCAMTVTGLSAGCSATLLLTQGSSPWTLSINSTSVTIPTGSGTVFALQLWSPDGSTLYVQPGSASAYLPLAGGTMAGNIAMGTNAITGLSTETYTANTVTVTSNAGTVPVTSKINNFTNSSSATMAITMATAGAVDGQVTEVRIYDHAATATTIGWTNTENSTVTAPTTSNGSTTLPLSVLFQYNSQTSKWRCIGSV